MHTNAPIGCQENYRKMKKEKTPKIQISDLHNFTTNGAKHNYSTQPSRLLQDSKLYIPFLPPSFLSNQTEANSAKIHHTTPKLHKYLKISEMQQRSQDAKTPPPIQHQMQLFQPESNHPTLIQPGKKNEGDKTKKPKCECS